MRERTHIEKNLNSMDCSLPHGFTEGIETSDAPVRRRAWPRGQHIPADPDLLSGVPRTDLFSARRAPGLADAADRGTVGGAPAGSARRVRADRGLELRGAAGRPCGARRLRT